MKRHHAGAFAALMALTPVLPAAAAPADAAGAARLTGVFQRYLGQTPGVVQVRPEGESYHLTLNATPLVAAFATWLAALEEMDLPEPDAPASDAPAPDAPTPDAPTPEAPSDDLDAATIAALMTAVRIDPVEMTLRDLGGGRWDVAQAQDWAIRLDLPGVFRLEQVMPITFAGIWDEALYGFSDHDLRVTNDHSTQQQFDETGALLMTQETRTAETVSKMTATANAKGGVDRSGTATSRDMQQNVKIHYGDPKPDGSRDGFAISAKVGSSESRFDVTGSPDRALFDLWAWAVAHPSPEAVVAAQDDLRARLHAVLPIADTVDLRAAINDFSVDSAFFSMAIKKLGGHMSVEGTGADTRYRLGFDVTEPGPPSLLTAEPWAIPLMPTEAGVEVTLSGVDLRAALALALDRMDLRSDDPFAALTPEALRVAVLPGDALTVDLAPGMIAGKDYQVTYGGTLNVSADGQPSGELRVAATGLDGIEARLVASSSPTAKSALDWLRQMRAGAVREGGTDRWTLDLATLDDPSAP